MTRKSGDFELLHNLFPECSSVLYTYFISESGPPCYVILRTYWEHFRKLGASWAQSHPASNDHVPISVSWIPVHPNENPEPLTPRASPLY